MAVTKKTVTPATETKETKETTKVEPVKAVDKVEKAVKEKKAPAKKAPAKKTATKKAELKSSLCVQFDNKSYSQEELLKIAKDVWKYDLKQKVGDLATVELYVKPEECKVYYVMNNAFTGSFTI